MEVGVGEMLHFIWFCSVKVKAGFWEMWASLWEIEGSFWEIGRLCWESFLDFGISFPRKPWEWETVF